ncbi:MAG TPA: hypothetical protein VF527_09570 [Pyrinomonadaceae bacterium]|jgi:hypothetical protein
MRNQDIIAWVLSVIDQVESGQPHEDSLVELKSEWPTDFYKAARRIAAHANAARGERILWIIGLNEKSGVLGVDHLEMANWYEQVKSHFDEIAPDMIDQNVQVKGKTLVALVFTTDNAPFVVKTRAADDKLEVPWREGTRTRSARRSELLRLLLPLTKLPSLQLLDARLVVNAIDAQGNLELKLVAKIYVVPGDKLGIVIPFHQCSGDLSFSKDEMRFVFDKFVLSKHEGEGYYIDIPAGQIVIDKPQMINLYAEARGSSPSIIPLNEAHVSIQLQPVNADRSAHLNMSLSPSETESSAWALNSRE